MKLFLKKLPGKTKKHHLVIFSLSVCQFINLFVSMFVCCLFVYICLLVFQYVCLSVCQSVCLSDHLSFRPSVFQTIGLSVFYLVFHFICLSLWISVDRHIISVDRSHNFLLYILSPFKNLNSSRSSTMARKCTITHFPSQTTFNKIINFYEILRTELFTSNRKQMECEARNVLYSRNSFFLCFEINLECFVLH